MLAWIRAGGALAVRFDGFLGTGWVRSGTDSDEWHMLYRFADEESLARWEDSSQRRWWLGAAQGLVGESRLERRTGIEGWFDEPAHTDVEDLRPAPAAPPRWKQMVVIWLAFFPLSLIVGWAARPDVVPGLPLLPRVLLTHAADDAADDLRRAAPDDPGAGLVAARTPRALARRAASRLGAC